MKCGIVAILLLFFSITACVSPPPETSTIASNSTLTPSAASILPSPLPVQTPAPLAEISSSAEPSLSDTPILTPTATATAIPPPETPTSTPMPPTDTPEPTSTFTPSPVPPTPPPPTFTPTSKPPTPIPPPPATATPKLPAVETSGQYGVYSNCGKLPDGSGREACDPAIVAKYYGTMPGPREPQDPGVIKLAEATWPLGTVIEGGLLVSPDGTAGQIKWVSARLLKPEYVFEYGDGLQFARWSVDLGGGRIGYTSFPLNVNEGVFRFMSAGHGGIVPVLRYPGADLDITNFNDTGGGNFDLE